MQKITITIDFLFHALSAPLGDENFPAADLRLAYARRCAREWARLCEGECLDDSIGHRVEVDDDPEDCPTFDRPALVPPPESQSAELDLPL